MTISKAVGVCLLVVGFLASTVSALNMETVSVGNPGNAGELSGAGAGTGGAGPDRICGAVAYIYKIGKYEVTAGQYTEFLNAVAATDTYGLYNTSMWSSSYGCKIERSGTSGNYTYSVASDWANRPVNYVSYWDACRFTNWLHNGQENGDTETGAYTLNNYNGSDGRTIQRNADWKWAIPTEDEWYKAAYHKNDGATGNYWDYPTSSDQPPGKDPLDPLPGNNANWGHDTIGPPYYRTIVGQFENSASPYGTFDQGGNVYEWNEGVIGDSRCIRGGSFDNTVVYALHAADRADYFVPSYEFYSIGFRVVEVPEPGTMTMLALGGLALIRRKRR